MRLARHSLLGIELSVPDVWQVVEVPEGLLVAAPDDREDSLLPPGVAVTLVGLRAGVADPVHLSEQGLLEEARWLTDLRLLDEEDVELPGAIPARRTLATYPQGISSLTLEQWHAVHLGRALAASAMGPTDEYAALHDLWHARSAACDSTMSAEPVLATVSLDLMRPRRLRAHGVLRTGGVVELDLGNGEPTAIRAADLPDVLAESLHLGPRPSPAATLLRCEREALDRLLDEPDGLDALLGLAFGHALDAADSAALTALAAAPVLHWRLQSAWGADRSRTCEVVDGGPAGMWRVATVDDAIGGGILLGATTMTAVWQRMSAVLSVEAEVRDD